MWRTQTSGRERLQLVYSPVWLYNMLNRCIFFTFQLKSQSQQVWALWFGVFSGSQGLTYKNSHAQRPGYFYENHEAIPGQRWWREKSLEFQNIIRQKRGIGGARNALLQNDPVSTSSSVLPVGLIKPLPEHVVSNAAEDPSMRQKGIWERIQGSSRAISGFWHRVRWRRDLFSFIQSLAYRKEAQSQIMDHFEWRNINKKKKPDLTVDDGVQKTLSKVGKRIHFIHCVWAPASMPQSTSSLPKIFSWTLGARRDPWCA